MAQPSDLEKKAYVEAAYCIVALFMEYPLKYGTLEGTSQLGEPPRVLPIDVSFSRMILSLVGVAEEIHWLGPTSAAGTELRGMVTNAFDTGYFYEDETLHGNVWHAKDLAYGLCQSDEEVRMLLRWALLHAENTVDLHRESIEKVARELLHARHMTADQIKALISWDNLGNRLRSWPE